MNDKPSAPEAFVQSVVNQAETTGQDATAEVHIAGHDITVTATPDGTITETAVPASPFNPPDGSGRR